MPETVLLYDAYSLIYRAFFAIRILNGPDGAPVNAIYGLTKMLKKWLLDHKPKLTMPRSLTLGAPAKAARLCCPVTRPNAHLPCPMLEKQLPAIREALQAFCIPDRRDRGRRSG